MTKKLVAYFSASGTTAAVARELSGKLGADLFEITPERPYSSADLNWTDKGSRSSVEMNDPDSRPGISEKKDVSAYGVVYLGFPIWWYTVPRIVNTFLESADFSGKAIVPFATSGGSGIEKCTRNLQKQYPGLQIHAGRLLNHGVSERDVEFFKAI